MKLTKLENHTYLTLLMKTYLDAADALQKDSPYYHVTEDNRDSDNIVTEHHISQIEKEG